MTPDRLLILDFDGTLAVGDDPVRRFALEVEAVAGAEADELVGPLDHFLRGEPGTGFEGCPDGYTAVAAWARERGLGRSELSGAFLRSRAELDAGRIAIATPAGVVDRLAALADWRRVLVTNSPLASTLTLTARLGLAPVLDSIVGDAAKPDGLRAMLAAGGDLDAGTWRRIVSIGDNWTNDLAPVHAVGGETGLIERHAQAPARPTWRGADVVQLLDHL